MAEAATAAAAGSSSSSSSSSSKNLWTVDECLAAYNSNADSSSSTTRLLRFVDASFQMGTSVGKERFAEGPRLPDAVMWDMKELSAAGDLFPEQNPENLMFVFPPAWFVGKALEATTEDGGDGDGDGGDQKKTTTLVVYGRKGTVFATQRVWYLLKQYCNPELFDVKILQGSLEDWIEKGGPVDTEPLPEEETIVAKDLVEARAANDDGGDEDRHPLVSSTAGDRIVDKEFVLKLLEGKEPAKDETTIIDVRGLASFQKGHIPGSLQIPFSALTVPDDPLTLRPKNELEAVLTESLGRDEFDKLKTKPPVLTCQAAVAVCIMALALDELGFPEPYVYDGSWNEWGRDPATPKAVGGGGGGEK